MPAAGSSTLRVGTLPAGPRPSPPGHPSPFPHRSRENNLGGGGLGAAAQAKLRPPRKTGRDAAAAGEFSYRRWRAERAAAAAGSGRRSPDGSAGSGSPQ